MHPDIEAWDAWHPRYAHERLAGVRFPWYVAGGWAVDLFLGRADAGTGPTSRISSPSSATRSGAG